MNLMALSDVELVKLYPTLLRELKNRGIIRTRNLVGELGKFIVKQTFEVNDETISLRAAPNSQKNYSFTDAAGLRYNLKTTSGSNTGVFHSVPLEETSIPSFEKLLVLRFSKDYDAEVILMVDWRDFVKFRQIKRPEGKWYVQINPEFTACARKIKPAVSLSDS
jgi:hypothetical protein